MDVVLHPAEDELEVLGVRVQEAASVREQLGALGPALRVRKERVDRAHRVFVLCALAAHFAEEHGLDALRQRRLDAPPHMDQRLACLLAILGRRAGGGSGRVRAGALLRAAASGAR